MELSVPHEVPLKPEPVTDQLITELGSERATGVNVATRTAVADVAMVPGALSCNEKRLVIVRPAEACFAGSASLCAVTVTDGKGGKTCGAVYFPVESMTPHAFGHDKPPKLQRMATSRCAELNTDPAKVCLAPRSTLEA